MTWHDENRKLEEDLGPERKYSIDEVTHSWNQQNRELSHLSQMPSKKGRYHTDFAT